ncbi:MAG: hypothetical protein ACI9XC_001132 [Gammaproteobacteria bacterium]
MLTWLIEEGYQTFLSTTELREDEQETEHLQRFYVEQGKISTISTISTISKG